MRASFWSATTRLLLIALALQAAAAAAPRPVPPLSGRRFWRQVLARVWQRTLAGRLTTIAGGVVFFGLLAIFPAITALVSSYGLFANPASILAHLGFTAGLMPATAYGIVEEQVVRIVARGPGQLSFAFALGLGIALWSANAGMKAIIDALNEIYGTAERRGFVRLNVVSLALTAGTIVAFLMALAAIVLFPLALARIGLGPSTEGLISVLRWPALLALIMSGLFVLYRLAPNRAPPPWLWLVPGAVFATLTWLGVSALFSWYLANFADYNATYGSLGAGIGLMMWLWLSVIVVLVGAQINAEVETASMPPPGR